MFCPNCGYEMPDGAKFCMECGASISVDKKQVQKSSKKRTIEDGEIHKCPFCGEIINSFVTVCPSCGNELRGIDAASTLQDFAKQVESKKGNEKIGYIKNYPLPNTKEDIIEFLILAVSNIDITKGLEAGQNSAWKSKYEQAFQKAKMIDVNSIDLQSINKFYEKKIVQCKRVTKSKKQSETLSLIFGVLIVVILWGALISWTIYDGKQDDIKINSENERLQAIVDIVYDYIDDGNYAMARSYTAQIVFSASVKDDDVKENWDKVREELYAAIDRAEGIVPSGTLPEADNESMIENSSIIVQENNKSSETTNGKTETGIIEKVEAKINAVSQWWNSLWD